MLKMRSIGSFFARKQDVNHGLGRPLVELAAVLAGHDIALVGNAASLFDSARPIDAHNVVVRLNKGAFLSAEQMALAGRRTDVLMVSAFQGPEYEAAAPHLVWATPKARETIMPDAAARMYFYPLDWWDVLHKALGFRPSTGAMAIDLIMRLMGDGRLTLYGFDFWKSETWYEGVNRPGPHDPGGEEKWVMGLVEAGKVQVR